METPWLGSLHRVTPVFHLFCALLLVLMSANCPAGELPAESDEIESFLRSTIEDGYREKDAGKVISAYHPDAEIVTHIFGMLSAEEYERETAKDFGRLVPRSVRLDLLEVYPVNEGAIVLVNLSVTGKLPGGIDANRHDRNWIFMTKGEEGWTIRRQSYRRDFGVTEKPHVFSR